MSPDSYLDPSIDHSSPINWSVILLILGGILTILVLIAVFFIIPHYAEKYFGNKINGNLNNLTNNNTKQVLSNTTYDCSSDIYNCNNFTTQAQAQAVYDYCINTTLGDVNGLDADKNGKACEGLD
jgi:hypothetical protein